MAFTDAAEPTAYLTPPGKPADFTDPLSPINAACAVLSPGSWLLKIIELVLPHDPVKWLEDTFAGDWAAYARCAETWDNLGKACGAVARNLDGGNKTLSRSWDGAAADAAFHYFEVLRKDLCEISSSLTAMSREYTAVAQGVAAAAEAIAECVSAMIDAAMTVCVVEAAAAALSWTGWAVAMGYALGAAEAQVIAAQWERATKLVNSAQLLMNASYAVLGRVGGELAAKLQTFPLPRHAYDHPAV
ncbi:hypothetical protein [Streptomyces sp. ISL-11]|uniref:hypothetical protein n=1 Tax=Streptomyces sp. ISL-11 TaxID=2819174 RepID=UPI001BEBC60F|nr:hypothetical protein [Streptomyces sp. ISL-11]MBT2387781.1 hypothetical protein [Streptomyces sp. ISL-11]